MPTFVGPYSKNYYNKPSVAPASYSTPPYSPVKPQVLGSSTSGQIAGSSRTDPSYANYKPYSTGNSATGGGGGQPPAPSSPPPGPNPYEQAINNQVDDFGALIDRDYEIAIQDLGYQEQNLQGQATSAEGKIRNEGEQLKGSFQGKLQEGLQNLATQEQSATKQTASATQQARDLFRQVQQQNIAQLAGSGLTSSSVSEALAERLGVETARRLSGLTGSLNEVVQNIGLERSRLENYTKQKLAEVEQGVATQIGDIQQSLLAGIRQLNTARQMAAQDKAQRRQQLLSQAQSAIIGIQQQAQQFAQSLEMWNQQKQASLADAARGFNINNPDFTGLGNAISGIQNIAGQGMALQPSFSIDSGGKITTKLAPKKDEEDDYTALLRQAGL